MFLQKALHLISSCNNFSTVKIYADLASEMAVSIVSQQRSIQVVYDFIQQAMEASDLYQKAAGEIIYLLCRERSTVFGLLDSEFIFGCIDWLYESPNIIYAAKSVSALITSSMYTNMML